MVPADPPPPRTMTGQPITPHPDDPPADGGSGGGRRTPRGLRDPGGPVGGVFAWLVILAIVGFIFLNHNLSERTLHNLAPGVFPAPSAQTLAEVPSPDIQLVLMGRYIVGASEALGLGGAGPQGAGAAPAQGMGQTLLKQLDDLAGRDPARLLRAAIVAGETAGVEAALDRIELAEDALDAPPNPPVYADEALGNLGDDAASLRQIYSAGPESLPADRREALLSRHGWFGRLALAHGLDDGAPGRAEVLGEAQRTMAALIAGALVAAFAILAGIALFVVAMVMLGSRRLPMRYSAPAPGGSAYAEVFALFLAGFLGVSLVAQGVSAAGGPDLSYVLIWALLLLPAWGLVRGSRSIEWRAALGWHTGRGVVREVFAGVLGYLAGLPIALLGIGMTIVLMAVAEMYRAPGDAPIQPTHPVMEQIGQGSLTAILSVYVLACVWAPLTEETFFRGALYHHLRGRLPAILSGLTTAFLFAAIHPQGWVAIPALGSLGFVFAMLREWRGSLIAPMVAHAINNGFVMTLLVLAVG